MKSNIKFVLAIVSAIVLMGFEMFLSGCSGVQNVWFGDDTAENNPKIVADFEKIPGEEGLYYAKDTKIVYWIGGSYTNNFLGATSYITPWYAPNGKPYLYDSETEQLVAID